MNEVTKGKAMKKSIPVDFIKLTPETFIEALDFVGSSCVEFMMEEYIDISTLEGSVKAVCGEVYIIRGSVSEVWPIRCDIFENTYEVIVNESDQV